MAEPLPSGIGRIAIVGVGLIGSSISHALRRAGYTGHVAVADASAEHLAEAERLRLGDSYHADPETAVADADVVAICTPIRAMGAVAAAIAGPLPENAVVFDTGSAKTQVAGRVTARLKHPNRFVPSHPIAGTENSGPASGFASLFDGRWCVLTPTGATDADAVATVAGLWRALGSTIETMTPEHHDLVCAITSHLPHLIAYNIVRTAYDLEEVTESEVIKFSAGGFRDFTRLAASDPTMWRDVFLDNRDAVLETLGRFSEDLAMLQRAIRWGDGEALFDLFSKTRTIRRNIIDAGQEIAAPDFGRHPEAPRR